MPHWNPKLTLEERIRKHQDEIWMLTSSINDLAREISRMRKLRQKANAKLDRAVAAKARG